MVYRSAAGQYQDHAPRYGRHKRMKWTEEHWRALCKLRSLDSPTRQASASTRALRMVLMDGMGVLEAAEAAGITRQALEQTLDRSRVTVEQANILAGATMPPTSSEVRQALTMKRLVRQKARIEARMRRLGK